MVTLPKKKIGLISCSGEDFAEGLMSRQATLKVLEELRPNKTVTLCLPLFLAGDKKERAFARVFPTIAIDGCSKQCAARATEFYSAKPTQSIIINDILVKQNYPELSSRRKLTDYENIIKDEIAEKIALMVDELLSIKPVTEFMNENINSETIKVDTNTSIENDSDTVTCNCGLNLPVATIEIKKVKTKVVGLPIIFDIFFDQNNIITSEIVNDLLEKVKLYNEIAPEDEREWKKALEKEYTRYIKNKTSEV